MTVPLPAPTSVPTAPITGSPGRSPSRPLATLVLVLLAGLLVGFGAEVVAAAPAQDPAPTEEPAPADDGLDPGVVTPVEPAPETDRSAVDAENRRIWFVVAGLVAVAVALALLTIRYWSQTRPVPVTEPVADAAVEGGRGRRGRRSRRAVAGADHAAADDSWEPRGTGEFDRVVVTPVAPRARLTTDQRRAVYRAHQRR